MANTIVNDVRSSSGLNDVTDRARTVLEPPEPLSKAVRKRWDIIIAARSTKEWASGIDLELAVILAKMLVQLDREERLLQAEGAVITGVRGGPAVNPRAGVVSSLRGSILRYEARLHFDVEQGGSVDRKNARQAERKAAERDKAADRDGELIQRFGDGLLPRPKPRSVQ